jgi:hypothetical protein
MDPDGMVGEAMPGKVGTGFPSGIAKKRSHLG